MFLKKYSHLGLVGRLVILVVLLSISIVAIVTFFNVQYNFISIRKELDEVGTSLEVRFKASFVQLVWNYDLLTLEEMIRSEFVNPLIQTLVLTNSSGEFLLGFERDHNDKITRLNQRSSYQTTNRVAIIYKRKSGQDEVIAHIHYSLDKNYLYSKMWKTIFLETFEFIMLTVGLALALSFMVVRRVLRPLEIIRLGLITVKDTLRRDFHFFSESAKTKAVAFPELKVMASELEDVFKDLGEMTDKLKENQQRLELVLSGASLGSWDWNLINGEYVVDDRWAKILGFKIEELVPQGSQWLQGIHPDDYSFVMKSLNDHFEGATSSYEAEYRYRHKSGTWLWILSRGKVNQKNSEGKPIRISGTHLDVTEKRKAQEEFTKLNILQGAILEYAGYAIVTTNPDGIITTFNKAAERMLGYEIKDLAQQKSLLVFHDDQEILERQKLFSHELGYRIDPGFPVLVAKSLGGIANENEWTYIRKDGSRFPVLLSVTTLRDPQNIIMGFLSVAVDISEQKKSLEAIRMKNIQLEALGAHAREMAIKAQSANEAKSKFIANMSHEIRTPMNAMIGYTDLLRETELNQEQANYISSIQSSGALLLDLVNNILEVTKIEAGVLTLKNREFSLSAIVAEVVELIKPRAQRKGIELTCSFESKDFDKLIGDPLRLRQIMINFIDNAVKFTEHGTVSLKVGPFDKISSGQLKVYFEVKDSGIGIERKMLSNLFTRFNQLDDSITKRFGGTGLGLAISREIIHLMNGDIHVDSELGQGTTFTFHLLFNLSFDQTEFASPTPSAVNLPIKPLKVLLAEDTEENQLLILHYFKKLPYTVDVVVNGVEALEKFRSETYDIILMDMQMPVMDGITATKKIRKIEQTTNKKAIPIIALTAYALDEQKEMCLASGCNMHISKPVKKDYLIQMILEQTQK